MELSNLRRFIIAQGVVVLLLVATAFFTATNLDRSLGLTIELTSLQEVVQAAEQINLAMEEERIAIGQYPLTGNPELLTRMDDAQVRYDQNWEVIVSNLGDARDEDIADIEATRETYEGLLGDVISEYQSNPDSNQAASLLSTAINYYLQNVDPKFTKLVEPSLKALSEQVERERARANNLSLFSKVALVLSIAVGVVVVVQVVLSAVFSQRLIAAMQKIVDAADSISRGDMDVAIDVRQTGEIGELARAIDRMRTSLKAAIERLRR